MLGCKVLDCTIRGFVSGFSLKILNCFLKYYKNPDLNAFKNLKRLTKVHYECMEQCECIFIESNTINESNLVIVKIIFLIVVRE